MLVKVRHGRQLLSRMIPLVLAVMVSVAGCRSSPAAVRQWDSAGFVLVIGGTASADDVFATPIETGDDRIVSSFWMSDHEVTQREWHEVMGSNPSYFQGESSPPARGEVCDLRPVEQVSFYDALVYCNRRSMREGLTPAYSINGSTNPDDWGEVPSWGSGSPWSMVHYDVAANGYRLPTEVEWEYAARGGDFHAPAWNYQYAGSDSVDVVAWYFDNSGGKTHEVKRKHPNSLGLYDMSGNVWEWCWGFVQDSSDDRCCRGGSWFIVEGSCSVATRNYGPASTRHNHLGFRVVRNAN